MLDVGTIKDVLKKAYLFVKTQWFIFFTILVYVFFAFYYLGPSVTSCTTTVYGFGDNTAGPIWQASLPEKQGPIGSFTSMTNAPYGDNLKNPIGYSLVAQTVFIRALTNIAGPICGYNIANMIGFVLSATIMFGFILTGTKNRWIALLAGFATSFAPYFQLKIGAHFSFGFQAIFIGIIWMFYNLIKYRRKRDAVLLAVLIALAIYWDPYYSLLTALIIIPLGFVWLLINRSIFTHRLWESTSSVAMATKEQFRLMGVTVLIVTTLLSPMVYVVFTQGKNISENVSASRGNVLLETKYCSNWPHEYLVPFMFNPFFEKVIGDDLYHTSVSVLRDHYSCGIGEDIIGLSITLVTIALLGVTILVWERINRRRTNLNVLLGYEPHILIYGIVAILFVAVLLGLPPVIFHGIPTPSYLMLKITSTWRTITRIFVIVNIAVITLAAISMTYFYKKLQLRKYKWLPAIIFLLIFGLVIIEYQTARRPFSGNSYGTFDYTKSVPNHYNWLKVRNDIKIIAEYPLERSGGEGNSMAYYLSMQVVHGKKLFNGSLSFSDHEKKKTGLKNLYDPQTLPVLKAMGVDAVVVHGLSREQIEKIPNTQIIHESLPSGFTLVGFSPLVTNDQVYILSLKGVVPQPYIIAPEEGFYRNMTYIHSAVDWRYLSGPESKLNVLSLNGQLLDTPQDVCFDIASVENRLSTLIISSKKTELKRASIGVEPVNIRIFTGGAINLRNVQGDGMIVSKVGCR